ncbi:uncharacterized protein KY384_007124 [Bacidia gigantensis]|uniref:uncharacterized protein n=1 Tax=Bacidia gigantensis TaxID=2732470 RepID=UPI001D0488A5|nr:uncharacterized protein KY384_007124 [Bacidia gigantensis]KAG8528207.1 hypothetical protein KY384_007124 [Bacidia gigantensis]
MYTRAQALQSMTPDPDAPKTRSRARDIENTAFRDSTSRASLSEYDKRCQAARINSQSDSPFQYTNDEQSLPSLTKHTDKPSRALGPYNACYHHYSGLFSTIYTTTCPTSPTGLLTIKAVSPGSESPPHDSQREARILTSLSHPNILHLTSTHTITSSPSTLFLLTYPFQPFTLSDLLDSTTHKIPNSILNDLFSALAHIHAKGILHRDIKPSNILLSSFSGSAVLTDFGVAWSPTDGASEPAVQKIMEVGTTCYRPPELLFGCRNYREGVDLWAAGCVAAEIFVHNASLVGKGGKGHRTGEEEQWTLFDAGELGSELALVKSIFETLGTPNEQTWPEGKGLPDWGKMQFVEFPGKGWEEILPGVGEKERQAVSSLIKYESVERSRAVAVSSLLL